VQSDSHEALFRNKRFEKATRSRNEAINAAGGLLSDHQPIARRDPS
jgi:hypothetical protein